MIRVFSLLAALAVAASAQTPSFRNDILPIFSKAGCNTGGCHGALAGKGGFRLSLFGYNPEADWQSITQESRGRRTGPESGRGTAHRHRRFAGGKSRENR